MTQNTGLYFPAADEVGITVGGTQVLKADSTGIDVTGTITFDGGSTSADLTFGDGDKAIFGAGSDLQIYHDGFNSYIDDANAGSLLIRGTNLQLRSYSTNENFLSGTENGAVSLYYDGLVKAATTGTGVDITGTAVTDGLTSSGVLSVDADAISQIKSGVASDVLRLGNDAGTYVLGFASALASMDLGASDNFRIRHGSVESFRATPSGVVLNEVSNSSVDFRVESDSNTHMLFVNAGTNRVGINEESPDTLFVVKNASSDILKYGGNPRLELLLPTGINGIRVTGDTTPLELRHLTNNSQFTVGSNYDTTLTAADATSGAQNKNSPQVAFTPKYWNGSASAVAWQGFIQAIQSQCYQHRWISWARGRCGDGFKI